MFQLSAPQQFKERLYENFKDAGVLDQLRLTLRKTLLDKLNFKKEPQIQQNEQDVPFVLRRKFLDRIVLDYLMKSGYEYTVSIMMPQASIQQDDTLSLNQLCRCLKVEDHQWRDLKKEKPTLLDVLIHVHENFVNKQSINRGTQTTFDEHLSKKLQLIDKQYMSKIDYWKLSRPEDFQQTLQKMRRDTQQKLRDRFESQKISLVNETEGRIRRQEAEKHNKMYLMNKRSVEADYEKKLLDLKRREKEALQSLQLKRKQCEERVQELRDKEHKMIKQYEWKEMELQKYFDEKTRDLKEKQKHLQQMELQTKVRKKQYEDCIRMVKNKVVDEASRPL